MRALALAALLIPAVVHADGGHTVTFEVSGVATSSGQILAVLYDSDVGYPSDPERARFKVVVPATAPVTRVTFRDVPAGTWAGFAVHDLNANYEVEVGSLIPIPKEPVGATRDAKGFMGPPKFRDAAFTVTPGGTMQRFSVVKL